MKAVLVNAVSAKHGGARTIVESFVEAAKYRPDIRFVFLSGFIPDGELSNNIVWLHLPMSGLRAVLFNLFGVFFYYLKYRCRAIISFNNMNCIFLRCSRKFTYFHQLKALDLDLKEAKLWIIRSYFRFAREAVFVQSPQVSVEFEQVFGRRVKPVYVCWPGVLVPDNISPSQPKAREVLVPIASPDSPHKNFGFVEDTAERLGPNWTFVVTAPDGLWRGKGGANIKFIGQQPRSTLFGLYQKASCVMLSSSHETIGLPIFEALAVGTPVVAFDASYIRSYKEKFQITSGLKIASSPEDASSEILKLALDVTPVRYGKDFCVSEWNVLFDAI